MLRSHQDDAGDADAATGRNAQLIPPGRFMDELGETVRRFCLYRKVMTIRDLGVRAGIAENRLEKLLHNDVLERKQATGSELLSIWGVLRAGAASEALAAIGMVASEDEGAGVDGRLALAVADLFDAGADLVRVAVDGHIRPGEVNATLIACDRIDEQTDQVRRAAKQAKPR